MLRKWKFSSVDSLSGREKEKRILKQQENPLIWRNIIIRWGKEKVPLVEYEKLFSLN